MRRRVVTLVWHRQERQAVLEQRAAISAGTWTYNATVVVCVGSMLVVESLLLLQAPAPSQAPPDVAYRLISSQANREAPPLTNGLDCSLPPDRAFLRSVGRAFLKRQFE